MNGVLLTTTAVANLIRDLEGRLPTITQYRANCNTLMSESWLTQLRAFSLALKDSTKHRHKCKFGMKDEVKTSVKSSLAIYEQSLKKISKPVIPHTELPFFIRQPLMYTQFEHSPDHT